MNVVIARAHVVSFDHVVVCSLELEFVVFSFVKINKSFVKICLITTGGSGDQDGE